MGWLFVIFGGMHVLLGLGLFGFVTWLMLDRGEDDVEDLGGGDGGSRLRPRPWRPGPGRPRQRRGPVRVINGDSGTRPSPRRVHQSR